MDTRLRTLIDDYLASVATAVRLLVESGFRSPSSNDDWACNGAVQVGELKGGVKYFKHGYGCMVALPGGAVDFDFGEKGEITGFDAWRLASFAEGKLDQYGFASEENLHLAFKLAVASGHVRYSGYILHYLAANEA
jgi:hypothetical protein